MIASIDRPIFSQSNSTACEQWHEFIAGKWETEINVRSFIQKNYTPYVGDASFLAPATENTQKLWNLVRDLTKVEREKGILDVDTKVPLELVKEFLAKLGK